MSDPTIQPHPIAPPPPARRIEPAAPPAALPGVQPAMAADAGAFSQSLTSEQLGGIFVADEAGLSESEFAAALAAPARTGQSAAKEARALWEIPVEGSWDFRRIEGRHQDIRGASFRLQKDGQAREQLAANREPERLALARLGPEARGRYERVAAAIAENPHAELALQVLLFEGRLAEGSARAGTTLLGALDQVAGQPLHPAIDRADLLGSLVYSTAEPSDINQNSKGTCATTIMQMAMAMQDPAEYVRLVGELATPEGTATLASGATLQREPGTEAAGSDARTTPSRLWQAAMTEYANGQLDYDNATDSMSDGRQSGGLNDEERNRVMDALFGVDIPTRSVYQKSAAERAELAEAIAQHANLGIPVPVGAAWGLTDELGRVHTGHGILVTRMTDERVYYRNPKGGTESMSREDFETRLWDAQFLPIKELS